MSDRVIGVGPFLGDFRSEILFFMPFVNWIKENVEHDVFFVNTHFNRHFLYNPNAIFFSIYEHLSRQEFSQKDILNKSITIKDFNILKKKFKKDVQNYFGLKKSTPFMYSLQYQTSTKNKIYQRLFKEISFDAYKIEEKDYILFIPDFQENIKVNEEIYDKLSKDYNVIVCGDMKIHLPEKNVITPYTKSDYFRNNYRWILSYMKYAKCIVCPGSHWTILSNLQKYPIVSWSKVPGIYRNEYHFENPNMKIFSYNRDTSIDILYSNIKYAINQIV